MTKYGRITALILALVLMMLPACTAQSSSSVSSQVGSEPNSSSQAQSTDVIEPVTLTYLHTWNGAGAIAPTDLTDNTVAKVIREKTGVTLDIQYISTPEQEKLNLAFATGDIPDIVNAPFWGGADACTIAIKNAASQGLLLPLDDLINQYGENVKSALTEGTALDFRENDLEDPIFNGVHYFIPQQIPKSVEDYMNWGVANFVRKDIIEALNVNLDDIKTSEDIYELLKKIRDGNFTDINGKPVIPSGTWANGWSYVPLTNSFNDNNLAGFSFVDGKLRYSAFSPLVDEQVLFMKKLIDEKLFDVEALTQNDTIATEKMATGRVALVGAHYFYMKDKLSTTLYTTNPEMEYVPLTALDANGDNIQVAHKLMNGRAGCPVIFFSKTNKNPEASMKLLNFMNSTEGKTLVYYGVDGTHYTMADGKPRMTTQWVDNYRNNVKLVYDEGIQSTYTAFVCLDDRVSFFGEQTPGTAEQKDEAYELVKKRSPLTLVNGYRISYFKNQYDKAADIDQITDWSTYNDTLNRAYFAKTNEEALQILNAYREQLIKGGIEAYEEFINQKANERSDALN